MSNGTAGLREVTARLATMVAAGTLTEAEAEGVLMAWLDRNAPEESGEVTAKRIGQMERERRVLVEGLVEEMGAFDGERLARAREGMLGISDAVWREAGGAVDGEGNSTR